MSPAVLATVRAKPSRIAPAWGLANRSSRRKEEAAGTVADGVQAGHVPWSGGSGSPHRGQVGSGADHLLGVAGSAG